VLWNSLLKQLWQPSAPPSHGTATDSSPLLALSLHPFHSKLKTFLFEQSIPPYSCLHQHLSVLWPLDLTNVFTSQSFSLCRSFSLRSSTPVSVNKPPSVLSAWQALYRHSKSPTDRHLNGQWRNYYHYYYLKLCKWKCMASIVILLWWRQFNTWVVWCALAYTRTYELQWVIDINICAF